VDSSACRDRCGDEVLAAWVSGGWRRAVRKPPGCPARPPPSQVTGVRPQAYWTPPMTSRKKTGGRRRTPQPGIASTAVTHMSGRRRSRLALDGRPPSGVVARVPLPSGEPVSESADSPTASQRVLRTTQRLREALPERRVGIHPRLAQGVWMLLAVAVSLLTTMATMAMPPRQPGRSRPPGGDLARSSPRTGVSRAET